MEEPRASYFDGRDSVEIKQYMKSTLLQCNVLRMKPRQPTKIRKKRQKK